MNKINENMTIFFPVYNDENTIKIVTEKALKLLSELVPKYEIIIINDCSPDRSGEIADQLSKEHPGVIKVIHHPKNLGYGAALRSGFSASQFELIGFTDGDDEYDIEDFRKLLRVKDFYDLIITFRYVKLYSTIRIFISWVYNNIFRFLFKTSFRDISTGLRLVRKSVIEEIDLESSSPFIGAELTIKTMLKGFRVGEVGIQTFPRSFGRGSSTSIKNITKTILEMLKIHNKIFSNEYELPRNRTRNE